MEQKATIVEIVYCSDCGWLPRASWLAQELLQTFETDGLAVTLVPGKQGVFEVRDGFDTLYSRAAVERLPDPSEIKKMLRDKLLGAHKMNPPV